jgi:hypothetical protein
MDLSLKINIKIYYYKTIKAIKHCFGGRILFAVFLFSRALGKQPPDKAMGYVPHSYLVCETAICNVRRFDQAPNVLVALYTCTEEGRGSNFDQIPGYSDVCVVFRT